MIGKLNKNDNGRWEIVDGSGKRVEITSGDVIRVNIGEYWITTRVEHSGDYYAVVPGIRLYQGMPAEFDGYD